MANLIIPSHYPDGSPTHFAPMILHALHEHGSNEARKTLKWNYDYKKNKEAKYGKRYLLLNEDGKEGSGRDLWYQGRNIVFLSEGKNFAPTMQADIMYVQFFLWGAKPYIVLNYLDEKRRKYLTKQHDLCNFAQSGGFKDVEQLKAILTPSRGYKSCKRTLISWTGLKCLYPQTPPEPSPQQQGQLGLFG